MKKLLLFFFIFQIIFLVSCQKQPTIVIETDSTLMETIPITVSELQTMLDSQEDFVLYIFSPTCSSCQDFEPILTGFIEESHLPVYQITADSEFSQDNELIPYEFTPTIVIIQSGELLSSINPLTDDSAFTSIDSFMSYIKEYIYY
ncbi:MAG: thioredoxin family protein [Candidatus Izemoplasmatales bacterium]